MAKSINPVKKVSPIFLTLIVIGFVISLSALYFAFDAIINQSESFDGYSFLAIGFGGLALTAYMFLQIRGKPMHASLTLPRVVTTLECPKCDFKSIRDFQRGDYIFKKEGTCQKCEEAMTITAIYREAIKKK